MNQSNDSFTKYELEYLSKKRPDLVPMKIPSLSDQILDSPSLDQVILKFLSKYEVFIEPRSVGAWNGWDTISILNPFLFNDGSIESNLSDISGRIFYANRSNQIRSSAQEWNIWKRWALDHDDFEEYKKQFLKTVDIHNEKIKKEEEKLIRKAKLHNKKIKQLLNQPKVKVYISRLIFKENLKKKRLNRYIKNISKNLIYLLLFYFSFLVVNELRYLNITHNGDSYKFLRNSIRCKKFNNSNADSVQCRAFGFYVYKNGSKKRLSGSYVDCEKIKIRNKWMYYSATCQAAKNLGKF